jgi:subtilisin family serine protease
VRHGTIRLSIVALTALSVVFLPACTRRSHTPLPSGTPLPSAPPAQAACVRGLTTAAFRRMAAATPTPMPVSPATVNVDSNPQGLQVEIDGSYAGKTRTSQTLQYSENLHKITIFNQAGGEDYQVCYAQDANAGTTVYYNRDADTSAKVTSLQSVAISPKSAVRRSPRQTATAHAVPDLIEVQYRRAALRAQGMDPGSIEAAAGARMGRTISPESTGTLTRVVRVAQADRDRVLNALRARAGVVSAEPAQFRHLKTTNPVPAPNDPHFSATEQWDMEQVGLLNAWAYTAHFGAPSIKVAVIDTGLDTQSSNTMVQADLVSKLTFAESVINGVVTPGNAAVQDDDGHGTNVAGIAVATANNHSGFAGVAPAVSLEAIRIFSGSLSTTADEAQAIYDAVSHGANVINLSLGSCPGDGPDAAEKTAVDYAIAHGVFIAAAAGNERSDPSQCQSSIPVESLDFPAAYPGVMAVGASAIKSDNGTNASSGVEYVASYSNSGPNLGVVAPGGDPSSTQDPDLLHWISNLYSTTGSPPCSTPSNCYVLIAGTSQATPHVSGAAALLLSANSSLTPAQLIQILDGTADDLNDPNQGHGRLNVYRAMAAVTGDSAPPNYKPSNEQLVAFAYTNSGATNAAPQIVNVTFTGGIFVNADGSFRMADIPTTATAYKIGVWYDANGDGVVDAGDRFGASGACSASAPCASAGSITVAPVTGSAFALP